MSILNIIKDDIKKSYLLIIIITCCFVLLLSLYTVKNNPYRLIETMRAKKQIINLQNLNKIYQINPIKDIDEYMEIDKVPKKYKTLFVSGSELRHRLEHNHEIPEWFSYPDIVEEPVSKFGSISNIAVDHI